ncbi:hypothetical protein [Thermomonospora curvata]|nr:hypothetical protein [Thermomonospora curvata]
MNMIFMGLFIAGAAIAAGIGAALANDAAAQLFVFGEPVPGVTTLWHVFLAGVIVATVFIAGLTLAVFGTYRYVRTKRELRYLREEHEESITALEMEKRHLERELARIRRESGPGHSLSPPSHPHPPQQPVVQ